MTGSTVTKYYYAGSQRIAMRTGTWDFSNPVTGTLNFLLGDHLGSTSLTTDASGNVVSEIRYKAWGTVRYATENVPTKYQYTGQYSYEAEFGLYFYNARWYDPVLSRFNQPDAIVPDLYNSQNYDRYAYVLNNPISYTDPSGHTVDCALGDGNCRPNQSGEAGLFLLGNKQDTQRVVDIINRSLQGYTVFADDEGRLSIQQTGDISSQTSEQIAIFNYLNKYIYSDGHTQITVVAGSDLIPGDFFPTGTVDVADVEAFGSAPGVSSISILMHAFEEQYQRQVNGIRSYQDAHDNYAVPAEQAVAGAIRYPDQSHRNNPLAVTVTYEYPGGLLFHTLINRNPFTVIKHGDDPINRVCR